MSGGELDYIHYKVRRAIDDIHEYECTDYTEIGMSINKGKLEYTDIKYNPFRTPKHLRFLKHLSKVADALKDIEWVMSGDTSLGDELPAINKVLSEKRKAKRKS